MMNDPVQRAVGPEATATVLEHHRVPGLDQCEYVRAGAVGEEAQPVLAIWKAHQQGRPSSRAHGAPDVRVELGPSRIGTRIAVSTV